MKKMGCSFFTGLTQRVSTSSTAARISAFQRNRSVTTPVCAYPSKSNSAIFTTSRPAAAIRAIEQGRRP